ncbi:MAG: glycosyltransferase family 2 protein, partial [Acidobacteriota bacterium]|nr:glycosyltransferase family 2 protein [Acidobacteriota bacterium]
YDRRRARWAGRLVHESVTADGPVGRLNSELLHYAYRDISHHLRSMDRYSTLAARQMFEDGRRAGWWDLALHPPAAFVRNYLMRGGFRDGVPGLIVSTMNARYVGLKLAKLWELCSASTSIPPGPGAADNSKRS